MVIGDTLDNVIFVHKAFKTAVESSVNSDSAMAFAASAATIAYAMLF